jgi:hypothetical protein
VPGRLVGWLVVDPQKAHMADLDAVPQPTGGAADDRHGMATSGGWVATGCSPFLYVFAGIGARLCARRLDAALASGVEPTSDRLLSRRAAQLTNRRTRERFADALDACAAHARRPKRGSSLAVPISRDVLYVQADLCRLALDLRGTGEVSAQGMAHVRRLLTDGTSPIYAHGPSGMLAHTVAAAVACLGDEPHRPREADGHHTLPAPPDDISSRSFLSTT